MVRRGDLAYRHRDLGRAERSGRWVIARLGAEPGDDTGLRPDECAVLTVALELVGCVRREVTDFEEAACLHRRALTVLDSAPEHHTVDRLRLLVLGRLGEALRILGQFAEAEVHLLRAVELANQLEPTDPIRRADALNGLGILCKDSRRFTEAARHYHQALELLERALDPEHLQLAPLYHNLAGLHHALGRFADGEPFARRALQVRAQHEGLTTTGAAADLGVLGALLIGQFRFTEAEQILNESLAIWHTRYGPDHYEIAVTQHNLAALYAARGEDARATQTLIQVLNTKTHILGPSHSEVIALRDHLDSSAKSSDSHRSPSKE